MPRRAPKDALLQVRVTRAEKQRYERAAERMGMRVAEWMRQAMREKAGGT